MAAPNALLDLRRVGALVQLLGTVVRLQDQRVGSGEAEGSAQVIQAQVPMSEMLEYASALTSITGGQGEFHMEFSHYDEAPAHVKEKVVAAAAAKKSEES